MEKSSKRTLAILFVSLLLDLLGFTVILPLLPAILEFYSKNEQDGLLGGIIERIDGFKTFIKGPQETRFNIVLLGGFLGSLYSLLQFLISPMIGAMSDVYGRKKVLVVTMVGVACSYLVWSFSSVFLIFLLSRVLCGIAKGNISISTAIVTDVTKVENRGKGMAMIGVAFSLGFIFGPSIGAVFSILGRSGSDGVQSLSSFQYPALFAFSLALLDIILLVLFMPETLPPQKRASSVGEGIRGTLHLINPVSLFRFSAVKRISKKDLSNLCLLGLTQFGYLFLFSGLEYSLTFLVHQRFDYTSLQQGRMFLFIGVVMTLVQGGYMRSISPGTEKKTAIKGMALLLPGLIITGLSPSQMWLYIGLFLYSFGAGTVVPCLTTMVSCFGEGDEKGKVMGIFRSLGALARALGPFAACAVYWSYGPVLCYVGGGILIAIPLYILTKADKKKNE